MSENCMQNQKNKNCSFLRKVRYCENNSFKNTFEGIQSILSAQKIEEI